jgi:cobalt-zinc-cadmium efflux system outer membrane protein
MILRGTMLCVFWAILAGASASAQLAPSPAATRFFDAGAGLSLEEAIARAREHEPSLRAARSNVDVARGMRAQAGLRPNPTFAFERREEPAGTDNQTSAQIEWPLDLFRRPGRLAVADAELAAAELRIADNERRLAADVRTRYGELLASLRDLTLLDELVAATRRQHELLRARAEQGASPPLERDLLDVELRRLESDRILQVGRTETAAVELKRLLGLDPEAALTLRDTLEAIVRLDSATPVDAGAAASRLPQRPDVREAETRIGIADAKVGRAQRNARFDVSIFGSYMRMDAGFPQSGFSAAGVVERVRGVFQYASAGAMLTLPLFNRNQGEIAAARAERAGASAAYEAARLTATTQVAAALAQDRRAREAVAIYRDGAQALARQNLAVVGQSYDLGRVTAFEVLAEQRRYLDLERAFTAALRSAYDARTALALALGDLR